MPDAGPVPDALAALTAPLLDAEDAALAAARDGTTDEQVAAWGRVEAEKDRLADLGSALLVLALERGGLAVQRRLAGLLAGEVETYKAARAAVRLARRLAGEVDALRCELRELREQVDRVTPGVADPGRVR